MAYLYDRKNKKRYKIKVVPVIIALCLLIFVIYLIIFAVTSVFKTLGNLSISDLFPSKQEELVEEPEVPIPPAPEIEPMVTGWITNDYNIPKEVDISPDNPMWNLVLINNSYGIEDEFTFDNAIFNEKILDIRISEAYQNMYDDAKNAGHSLIVKSGYRSIKYEQTLYNQDLQALILKGLTEFSAMKELDNIRQRVGHTEHHTGLAIDVATSGYLSSNNDNLGINFAETQGFAWLVENCNNYGFILRYPQGKESITNVEFEPWHFRYVGVEHANAITSKDLTLEEYLANIWKLHSKKRIQI